MLATQRQEQILGLLAARGGIRVVELVEQLGVSEMTIRRDISQLDKKGLLKRVHGGAIPIDGAPVAKARGSYAASQQEYQVLAEAVNLVKPASSVLISGGSLAGPLAGLLTSLDYAPSLKIFSTSLPASRTLCEYLQNKAAKHRATAEVVVLGGSLHGDVFTGAIAQDALENLHFDIGFFQTTNFSLQGMSTDSMTLAATLRLAVRRCHQAVALVSGPMDSQPATVRVAGLSSWDTVITDTWPGERVQQTLNQSATRLIVCEEGS